MSKKNAQQFIQKMKSNEADLQQRVSQLGRNAWQELTNMGEELGLKFTPDELQDAMPSEAFAGAGSNPEQGWDRVRFS